MQDNENTSHTEEIPEKTYLRVGTVYYKKVRRPLASGDFLDTLAKWSYENLKRDFGSDILSQIPKYDGFCVIPDHKNYTQEIGSFYNRYLPLTHEPQSGHWPTIENFLKHIFQEQYQLGLDYIQLLYLIPTQKLPIIALVSRERVTGKTTFLMFLKLIFQGNMTLNNNEDFRSNFNSEWADKLLVGIDETFLDKKEDSERLKNLATSKLYKKEAKGQDRYEIEFFAKFILCSNNEENFIKIDPEETRYWVIKVPIIKHKDDDLLSKMNEEIPHFLYFLNKRELSTKRESRMWFHPRLIRTNALAKLIHNNRSKIELELYQIIRWIMDYQQVHVVEFCIEDARMWLSNRKVGNYTSSQIRQFVQNNWELKPTNNSLSYTAYFISIYGDLSEKKQVGRFYSITADFIKKLDEMMK